MLFIKITSSLFTIAVQTSKDGQNCVCGNSLTIEPGGVTRFDQQFEDSMELRGVGIGMKRLLGLFFICETPQKQETYSKLDSAFALHLFSLLSM